MRNKSPRRFSSALIAAAVVAVMIVGGFAWAKLHSRKSSPSRSAMGQSATVTTPNKNSAAETTVSPIPAGADAVPAKVTAPRLQATTGALRIESTPEGAIVQIDGRSSDEWLTPFTVSRLKPGTHTVSAAHSGVLSDKRSVKVTAGKRTAVSFDFPTVRRAVAREAGKAAPAPAPTQQSANPISKLKRLFRGDKPPENKGLLIVRTRPRGAQVLVDEIVAPELTPTRVPVDPGSYHVIVNLTGYKPIHRMVTIENGKSRKLDLAFLPE